MIYRKVRREGPQVLALTGEAGIGKTRLASEFLRWATAQGGDVLQGHAFEVGGRLPYQPLVEALRNRVERENAPDNLLNDVWLALAPIFGVTMSSLGAASQSTGPLPGIFS